MKIFLIMALLVNFNINNFSLSHTSINQSKLAFHSFFQKSKTTDSDVFQIQQIYREILDLYKKHKITMEEVEDLLIFLSMQIREDKQLFLVKQKPQEEQPLLSKIGSWFFGEAQKKTQEKTEFELKVGIIQQALLAIDKTIFADIFLKGLFAEDFRLSESIGFGVKTQFLNTMPQQNMIESLVDYVLNQKMVAIKRNSETDVIFKKFLRGFLERNIYKIKFFDLMQMKIELQGLYKTFDLLRKIGKLGLLDKLQDENVISKKSLGFLTLLFYVDFTPEMERLANTYLEQLDDKTRLFEVLILVEYIFKNNLQTNPELVEPLKHEVAEDGTIIVRKKKIKKIRLQDIGWMVFVDNFVKSLPKDAQAKIKPANLIQWNNGYLPEMFIGLANEDLLLKMSGNKSRNETFKIY